MTEAKLAPNLPQWMQDHANRYLSSGGAEGHMYRMTQPGRPEMTVPSLLLTTWLVSQHPRQSGRRSSGRNGEAARAGADRHRRRACEVVGNVAGVLAAIR
jgi:hypothetical protein